MACLIVSTTCQPTSPPYQSTYRRPTSYPLLAISFYSEMPGAPALIDSVSCPQPAKSISEAAFPCGRQSTLADPDYWEKEAEHGIRQRRNRRAIRDLAQASKTGTYLLYIYLPGTYHFTTFPVLSVISLRSITVPYQRVRRPSRAERPTTGQPAPGDARSHLPV